MFDQGQETLSTQGETVADLTISAKDREILRPLGSQVAQLAARPIEQEKHDVWYRHHALDPTRPLVFCSPENGWIEILTLDRLKWEGELARRWEITLRKEIFWGTAMRDDRVIEPRFNVSHVHVESDWGMHETVIGGEHGGAYVWDAPPKNYHDMDQLHFPPILAENHVELTRA